LTVLWIGDVFHEITVHFALDVLINALDT
jgi:hypothetical protein